MWYFILTFIFGGLVGFGVLFLMICTAVKDNIIQITPKRKPIDDLKNSLLSAALCVMNKSDPSNVSFSYMDYDGTTLPPFSGSDFVSACMSNHHRLEHGLQHNRVNEHEVNIQKLSKIVLFR